MLRVVADANVLISAALTRSPQAPSVLTLDAALDGRAELVTSPLLLREVASNRKEIAKAEDVDPPLDDLLQALLGADHTRRHLLHRLVVYPPKSELDWHRQ